MNIENNQRLDNLSRKAIIVIAALLFVFLTFGIVHTMVSFVPRANKISVELQDMQEQMDEILSDINEIKADLNWDGQVDQLDLDLLFDYILRRPGNYPTERMDLNGDGRIDSSDLHSLYQIVKELEAQHDD
jgi:predicted PurR-regulated permease PerM